MKSILDDSSDSDDYDVNVIDMLKNISKKRRLINTKIGNDVEKIKEKK